MRKTIILGILIALSGAGALAQAGDVTATEQKSPAEASQSETPAMRGDQSLREHRSAAREEHRDRTREHRDEARESHDEHGNHGQRH